MSGLFAKIFGDVSSRTLKKIKPIVAQVNALEEETEKLADADFPKKTEEFKSRLAAGETLDDLLPEAFALVREAAKRTLGQRHYDVQIVGGVVIHQGAIAEMRTGEGKTLVATLPSYLNALEGKGVHVVTVNDYLAARDADWMGQVYAFLGLSVGVINGTQKSYLYTERSQEELDARRDEQGGYKVFHEYLEPCTRKQAYDADITYGTNNEFGFDYLRDNTQKTRAALVQRGQHFVVVDEIDSILIDEARVPLILSAAAEQAEDLYTTMAMVANQLSPETDYEVDEKLRAVTLTNEGVEKAQQILGIDNLYTQEHVKNVHHLETAVRAKAVFVKDKDYVCKDNKVIIIDQFTGRLQDGRRFSDGLHQALEAKEGVEIKQETRTFASITYQNYFKFYNKLSGMTGTAVTSSEEFLKIYSLDVIVIPTNKPIARKDNVDFIYQTEQGKFKAIAAKIRELNEKGQPVLVGTASVERNELLSAYLRQEGVAHEVLNAKNHESEGAVTAFAGKKGAVTIATNMAGRGVDIKLGGPEATPEQKQEILDLGGLFVLGTERHDARRIDNQLRGRAGRQGEPGETQFYVSLEDQLMRVFGSDKVKSMMGTLGIPEDQPIQSKIISNGLEGAQEKIEGFHFDSRKHILSFDDVLARHRNTVYERRRKILEEDTEFVETLYGEVLEASGEQRSVIQDKKAALGEVEFMRIFRELSLGIVDLLWMEHLQVMDNTRQSVNLRAYGQREPVVEYKKEGLRLFREMEASFKSQIAHHMALLDVEAAASAAANPQASRQTLVSKQDVEAAAESVAELGRNEKVVVVKGGEEKEIKVKKLEEHLAGGWTLKN